MSYREQEIHLIGARLATRRERRISDPEIEPTMETQDDEMRTEYDFSGGVRGKYYEAYQRSSNVVVLDPDIAAIFPDSASVNEALRLLAKIARSVKG